MNFPELGYHTHAQVFLKVAHHEKSKELKEKMKTHLSFHNNVNTVYKVNNGWDFMIETVHKNIKELNDFLEELEEKYYLQDKEIHYLIEEVKKEGFTFS